MPRCCAPSIPGAKIATAILWSRTATLMELPDTLVMEALGRAGHRDPRRLDEVWGGP